MSEKKYRVSAKQRLALVKAAWEDFNKAIDPDVEEFASRMVEAFSNNLEPKNKQGE